jgi:hypothetical protein
MTELPLSDFRTGAGVACINPHRGELDFFYPQRGNVQAISKLRTFVLEYLKCTDVISTRSEAWFIK